MAMCMESLMFIYITLSYKQISSTNIVFALCLFFLKKISAMSFVSPYHIIYTYILFTICPPPFHFICPPYDFQKGPPLSLYSTIWLIFQHIIYVTIYYVHQMFVLCLFYTYIYIGVACIFSFSFSFFLYICITIIYMWHMWPPPCSKIYLHACYFYFQY